MRVEHDGEVLDCPQCGAACAALRHASAALGGHLDTCQYRTILVAELPRVHCERHKVKQVAGTRGAKAARGFTALFEAVVIDWLAGGAHRCGGRGRWG